MSRSLRSILLLAGALALLAVLAGPSPSGSLAIQVEPVIWQLDRDYPGSNPDDAGLPITTVYIKTHDETYWMSEFDDNPNAVSGPDIIRELIQTYGQQGIEVAAWFVPKGTNYDRQVEMAVQVIDSGVTALYADLEPFEGFCYLDCHALAQNFWTRVRQERPNARLGVIYDPRPWWWGQSATPEWLAQAEVALPMCYWELFAGQSVWGDPGGCVTQGHADLDALAPGRQLEYIPMLQGDSTAEKFEQALDAAVRVGSERVSVWRRGVVPAEVWDLIGTYAEPVGPACGEAIVDGCLVREATGATVWLIHGGARFGIPSPDALIAMGYTWRDVQVVPIGATEPFGAVPRNGTILREHGDTGIWVVYGGARFFISSPEEFSALGLDPASVRVIPQGGLGQIPLVPVDYTIIREIGAAFSWLVLGGARIPVNGDVLAALASGGRSGLPEFVVPAGSAEQTPIAQVKRGDSDCDGEVSSMDAIRILQRISQVPQSGICAHLAGDVDCDALPTPVDALRTLEFVSGIEAAATAGCGVGSLVPAYVPEESPPAP
jgi:hypothetical protein